MFLSLLLFTACRHQKKTDLITIDILDGLKTEKEFRLSEIVDGVEYVKLETTPECLFSEAAYMIGKNYILVTQDNPKQIFLFTRSGKYIRKIGRTGKGPDEYVRIDPAIMDPEENYILTSDYGQGQIIKFDMDGRATARFKAREFLQAGVACLLIKKPDEVWISLDFPLLDKKNFPLLRKLDGNLRQTDSLFPVTTGITPDIGRTWGSGELYLNDGVVQYRPYSHDTLYSEIRGKLMPRIFFPIRKDHLPGPYVIHSIHKNSEDYSEISCIKEFHGFLIFYAQVAPDRGGYMVYSKSAGDLFLLKKYTVSRNNKTFQREQVLNDIDGMINPGNPSFWPEDQEFLVQSHEVIEMKDYIENGRQEPSAIKFPNRRKQFIDLIKASKVDDNPILQIFHLKL
ncbi:MAG: 6-bladed beta-propeller [Bacteroidia bacterium]|nr:6-bladed beta-propeller [Bacteroidia bacterium]